MQAQKGDRLIVRGNRVGDPDREAVVVEVRGEDGGPPFIVRWEDGHEGLFFPGPNTHVEHHGADATT
jgi:Domain of unknown function (DUF1918)